MLKQKFAALKPLRQGLAHGLFDHSRAGETDQRAGFPDMNVAEHGEACRNAPHGRIGQDTNIRQAPARQPGQRGARLGHLQQREQGFLHARTAARGKADQRHAVIDGGIDRAHEFLADDGSHRSAHKTKLEGSGYHFDTHHPAGHDHQSILFAGRFLRLRQPVAIPFIVAKPENVIGFAGVALRPESLGYIFLVVFTGGPDLGRKQFFEPVHAVFP